MKKLITLLILLFLQHSGILLYVRDHQREGTG
jgi:hypothetical protein